MKKKELQELATYVGDTSSVIGMTEYAFCEGKAKGVRAIGMKNGLGLELTVLADKCLDISHLIYKGVNFGVASKTGVVAPEYFVEDGRRGFLKSFNVGFFTTCGLTYSGAPCEIDGRKYGLHGVIANTPAEQVNKEVVFLGEHAALRVGGTVREACVFEENMVLEREILLSTEENIVYVNDTVRNMGFSRQPIMNDYHINFGYPLLSEGAIVYVSAQNMEPRDEPSVPGIDTWFQMEKPQVGYIEQCFLFSDDEPNKESFAMLVAQDEKTAGIIHYDARQCPILCEWKSMLVGDYALGLEPTTCGVNGLKRHMEDGSLPYLEPGEEYNYNFAIEITEDAGKINEYIRKSSSGAR